jgi:hypothetical protein
VPSGLEHAQDVDASIQPLQNLLADQPGHLTVAEAKADQLSAAQDPSLAFGPDNRLGRKGFCATHDRSLRTPGGIVRESLDLWKSFAVAVETEAACHARP